MRHQRLSYRYAAVIARGQARPLGSLEDLEQSGVRLARAHWCPPADVYETDRTISVTVELAGVDPEALEVLLFEDAVAVEGERRLPPEDDGGVYHAAQIRQGPFRLELALPAAIDPDRVEARYERGLLRLVLPKREGGEGHGH